MRDKLNGVAKYKHCTLIILRWCDVTLCSKNDGSTEMFISYHNCVARTKLTLSLNFIKLDQGNT